MATNRHPSDEDLILHFYGEADAADARRIAEHVDHCGACRAAWMELDETLRLVDQARVQEPGPEFERVMWARVQQALPAPRASLWSLRVWLPAAATIAVVAVASGYAWRTWHTAPEPATTPDTPTQPATQAQTASGKSKTNSKVAERVLLGALDDHFQQAQTLLVELNNAPEDAGDFVFERATADELISSGRLYRVAARQHGDRQFVLMLDELETALLDVARSENGVRPEALKALRDRIESQDLLFKVRVATRQVHERQKDLLTSAANE
jgi:hypothetical protein